MKLRKTTVEIEGRTEERWVVEEGEGLSPWEADRTFRYVGRPRPRVDGRERVTGQALYASDFRFPGMLHARFVRSPHAHARLESIDTQAAADVAGLVCVLGPDDGEMSGVDWRGGGVLVREALFAGHEVALVCAETPAAAEEAARRVAASCRWKVLGHHVDPRRGLEEDAHRLEPDEGNLIDGEVETYERGDAEEGFRKAHAVVEGTYETACMLHNALETHGGVALWEGEELVLHTSTQHVFGVREQLAEKLGLALSRIRVLSPYMGGGFGAKNNLGKPELAASLLARRTGRPVRCFLDRREENLATGNRPASVQRVRIGATREGTLTALELEGWTAVGAWAGWGTPVAGPLKSLYDCPSVRVRMHHVRTHTGPQAAFRAPGYVEGTFALEQALDDLAGVLNVDPLELRRRNEAEKDPVRGNEYTSKGLGQAYREGARIFGWSEREGRRPTGDDRWVRGFGMASQIWGGGGGPPAYATLALQGDGTALLSTGTQDLGTGTKTVLLQVAAEESGLDLEDIRIEIGDTRGPYAPLSAGSMTVASVAPAVRAAAAEARRELLDVAAQMLGRDREGLRVEESAIWAGEDRLLDVAELTGRLGNVTIFGRGSRGPNPEGKTVNTFAGHFVQVRVDTWTGRVEIERYVAAHDSGRILNPLTAGSQILGGVTQGAGFAFLEGRHLDEATGVVLDPGLESYKIPTLADAPPVDVHWVDPGDESCNPLGAKGVGEPPIIPAPAALANAVADALGVRIHEAPLAPWRVLEALDARELPDAAEEASDGTGGKPS